MQVKDYWGFSCPRCHRDDRLDIAVTVSVRPVRDSAEIETAFYGDGAWHRDSHTVCRSCGWRGRLQQASQTILCAAESDQAPAPAQPAAARQDERPGIASEPTSAGLQYILPGCEHTPPKRQARPDQLRLL